MGRVLFFSFTAMANPTLVAATTLMLLLPSPKKLMFGYLLGALLTSVTIGLVIIFALKDSSVPSTAKNTANPIVDFAVGGILLIIGIVLGTDRDRRIRERRAQRKSREEAPKIPRWQQFLRKGNPRITFAVGAVLTLPGASYLAALDSIRRLHYGPVGNVVSVLLVNVIMLALIEVPLVCFTFAPRWTPAAIERVKAALRRHGHTAAFIGATAIGLLLILQGVVTVISS
jgi:Sap-like sulfolipid-1-addressing protein